MARLEFLLKRKALGLVVLLAFALGPIASNAARVIDTTGMAPITIDVQNANILSVLRTFSEFANVNIVPGPEVDGKVTVKLIEVPWLVALDTVLRANGYGWEQENDIIRVTTLEKLNNERLNEEVIERKREEFLPLETQIIRVSYANAQEMKKPLETLLSQRGKIETDERTNALVVTDIHDRIERVREMAKVLDFKTSQVEINAKLVDVDARYVRDIGINWSVLGLNEGDAEGDIRVDASIPDDVGEVRFGLFGTDADFETTIQMLESENKAEIISNPRITTADNKAARIIVGKKVPLVVADEAGNAITQLTTIGIKLEVTPHINQDGRVTLDLFPEVSDLSSQATVQGGIIIVTAQAETRVIVQDGETAVIGGLIRTNEGHNHRGIPLLKDIPLLGYLFRSTNKVREDRELLIFVTPKILRPDEA
jgi:type II secretory pathway component HofQ